MKLLYTLLSIFICLNATAQTTEVFESENPGATIFSDNGQAFSISSVTSEGYKVTQLAGKGWNGTAPDDKFIDSSPADMSIDGSSFTISTTIGNEILTKSLYILLATAALDNPQTEAVLTIEGKKDGVSLYTITKNTGFSDVTTSTPNNGFTFIDFSTEGGADNSTTPVDELVFTSTWNADVLALDALTWEAIEDTTSTSINDIELTNSLSISPNPTNNAIQVSGLLSAEKYSIYNTVGTEVKAGIIKDNEKIEIQDFTNGLYFLKFENRKAIKIIKE